VRKPGDERAQIRILEDVGVRVSRMERPYRRRRWLDRRDIDRLGREPLLKFSHPPCGLRRGDASLTNCVEDRVRTIEQPVHA
jgi:hypothetical protein